jgi:hypothetical protein
MRCLTKAVVRRAAINSLKATMVVAVVWLFLLCFGEPIAPLTDQNKFARGALSLLFMAGILFCIGLLASRSA